jgi:diketogulonate reductase-like aldo/keto reductase
VRELTLAGRAVPVLGQGTWHMGERGADRAAEARALALGLDLGLTLIDTAEMYADGGAEEVTAAAIAGRRDEVFLVSKAYPQNATARRLAETCRRSLGRLRTDRIDLYLLHWQGNTPLPEVAEAFSRLQQAGDIGAWGVSNLDVAELAEIADAPQGAGCATDQVLYNLECRGIEWDLLPWCAKRDMPVMAYSPVGQGGALLRHSALGEVAGRHGVSLAQAALAWTLRHPHVLAIPKASDPAHVRQNRAAADLVLTEEDLRTLDRAFPPPRGKVPLDMR